MQADRHAVDAERLDRLVQVDLALGLDVSRAAKAEGTAPDALVADAIRLYLDLGPVGVARARDFLRRRSEAA